MEESNIKYQLTRSSIAVHEGIHFKATSRYGCSSKILCALDPGCVLDQVQYRTLFRGVVFVLICTRFHSKEGSLGRAARSTA